MAQHNGSQHRSFSVPLAVQFFCLAVCRSFYTFACTAQLEARQWTHSICGFIFSTNELGVLAILPLSVFSVQKFGSRLTVHYGVFIIGVTFMLTGFADNYAGDDAFMYLSFVFRLAAGVGSTLAYMASFTLVLALPFRKSTYLCLLVPYAFGLICGSLLGATAQDAGRFELCYILLGFFVICVSYVVPCNLPLDSEIDLLINNHEILIPIRTIIFKSLRLFSVRIGSTVVAIASLCLSFATTTIGPFLLSELKLTAMDVWATFALLYCTAMITAVVVGLLCNQGAPTALFTATGLICMLSGLFFMGPADSIEIPMNWSVGVMGVMSFGLGFATTFVSIYASLIQTLQTEQEHVNTICGIVTTIFAFSHAFGTFLGEFFSGIFVDSVGFNDTTVLTMFPVMFAMTIFALQICYSPSNNNLINLIDEATDVMSYGSIENSPGPFMTGKDSASF